MRSARLWRYLAAYFRRYVRRHFNAVRIAQWGMPAHVDSGTPIIIVANHPAWWDLVIGIVLADALFPQRASFVPFDERMLQRYGVFRRIGAFGIDQDHRRGAAYFLAASRDILAAPGRALWITAQGRFADVRQRPLDLLPGVAHLVDVAPEAMLLPLALEYGFWEERGAEAFAAFGPPVPAASLRGLTRAERLVRIEAALVATLDRLGTDVVARDPARFVCLAAGKQGPGGIYDVWRRLAAWAAGRRFDPAHLAPSPADRARERNW